jgi:hypothetical protein
MRCAGGQFGISERHGDAPDPADVAAVEIGCDPLTKPAEPEPKR